ncbi:MAG: proton-conducting transporter membrane subunit, partial [Clostridiales bacterium]|nr:proton-conducting transporter membrane subunit [Clostridiales bacterium]
KRQIYVGCTVVLNFLIVALLACTAGGSSLTILHLNKMLDITLKIDGMSQLFTCLASFMWVMATFYSFEYVKHEGMEERYFTFFVATMGVIVGIGYAGNLQTLYLFYEMMTLITFPLVMHSMSEQAVKAGKKYLIYSFVGATVALVGLFFLFNYCETTAFVPGGTLILEKVAGNTSLLQTIVLLTVMGFGCKAGMFPLHAWLPTAHPVAPAPASALLSGIITKAGVLAIIRVCYFMVGADFIRGSWVQYTLMSLTLFTVFMGSMLAYKEKLFKKRLAYSSVSQVSYVLFGLTLFHPVGFVGALLHIVFHAVIKNILFLSAGSVIYKRHKTYVTQLRGIGKEMPITMWCFTLASIALIGIPPTSGFVSKWFLATGAMQSDVGFFSYLGPAVLLVSALLTAGYLMPIVAVAFFPGEDYPYATAKRTEANCYMTIPMVILTVFAVVLGMFTQPLLQFFQGIAGLIM